ncbi:ethylene-responsive transcription factor-like protein At4g13040 isoform X2 [Manihot esculenta]|uniref:ethylene-responsive transcription factor-like protein At4g13040 isoform X2 n=1 Tax=Manihot esculenta TaxID=3983 RepID=UPI001CC56125|nr:ethylene-responsive transcription factor-like protein At4g13040 isoform X2 [Manihot esculenta]
MMSSCQGRKLFPDLELVHQICRLLAHRKSSNLNHIQERYTTLSFLYASFCLYGQPVKRRKRHRRKHVQNQEPCVMRGVYFKNLKWQAAIKVDKKQIHLGTVGSQEEAARLYDRAAFMCGREPNFELSEEEKQELRKYKWDEFLAITRSAINNKKHKRHNGAGLQKRSEPESELQNVGEWDDKQGVNSFSASEDGEPDSSTS